MSTRALLVGAGALLAVAAVAAQSPETQRPAVTFRVQVDYVEVDAIVTDRQGRFVRDLAKDDFEVIEDGKPQPIAAFSAVDIPIEPRGETWVARIPRAPREVASNARAFDGRLFMLVLDDLQTSVLNSVAVRERARAFVEKSVGDNDLVAVVQTGSVGRNQDFTSDRARLLAAIEGFTGTKRRSAASVILEARQFQANVEPIGRQPTHDTEDPFRANDAIRAMGTLKSVAAFLGGIRGRKKALVYIGEGIDYEIKADAVDPSGKLPPSITRDVRAVEEAIDDAIATATRNNVSIYCLDPRGLSTGADEAIALPGIAMLLPDGKGSKHGIDLLGDALVRSQASMRTLSEATGGLAFINSNDFTASLSRIVEDSSRHYILGYYAPEGRRDGRFRRVDVRVKREGLEVRARKGYYAPTAAPVKNADARSRELSPSLFEAMQNPLPVSGLAFSASALAFAGGARDSVELIVELDPARLGFTERGGVFRTDIELQVNAIELASGTRSGTHHVAQLRLGRESYARVQQHGLRIMRRVELPPGRYRLHVGARDATSGAVGTVLTDFDAPDFAAARLTMSGLAVASAAGSRMLTADDQQIVEKRLPGAPTNLRVFPSNDTIALLAEIYGADRPPSATLSVRTTITAANGTIAYRAIEERPPDAPAQPRGATWSHVVRIPMTTLAPGSYVLQVEAGFSPVEPAIASRALAFDVKQ